MNDTFAKEWQAISERLDIRIELDVKLELSGSEVLIAPVRVLDFGAVHGMLLFSSSTQLGAFGRKLFERGYGYSVLSEPIHGSIDYESVKEMLMDWGWTGSDADKPRWLG